MGITVFLLLALILRGEKGLITGQGPVGGDDLNDCCPFITVDVGGDNTHLDGDYNLKEKKVDNPEPEVCINGCIYTKDGSSSTAEYCFKTDNAAGADVKCSVGIFSIKL